MIVCRFESLGTKFLVHCVMANDVRVCGSGTFTSHSIGLSLCAWLKFKCDDTISARATRVYGMQSAQEHIFLSLSPRKATHLTFRSLFCAFASNFIGETVFFCRICCTDLIQEPFFACTHDFRIIYASQSLQIYTDDWNL